MKCWPNVMRVLVALLMVAVLRPVASADEPDAAAAIMKRGQDLMQARQYDAALEAFTEAAALRPSPRAHARIGLALVALRRPVEAKAALLRALSATADPWIVKNRAVLESELQRLQVQHGHLEVHGTPAGAEVVVDDRWVGVLPLREAVRLQVGQSKVRVSAPGYQPSAKVAEIRLGAKTRIEIDLSAIRSEPAPVAASVLSVTSPARESARSRTPLKVFSWTAVLLGSVGAGVGTSMLVDDRRNLRGNALAGAGAGAAVTGAALLIGVFLDESRAARPDR